MTLESAVLTKDMREVHDRSCGVKILNLDQFQNKAEDLFANGQTHPHVLAQSRRFNPGEELNDCLMELLKQILLLRFLMLILQQEQVLSIFVTIVVDV